MKLWPVAHFFHSLLESGNIQNIAACHFLTAVEEMTCCNVLYVPWFQKWVKKMGNRSEFHSERNYYLQNWYFNSLHGQRLKKVINTAYDSKLNLKTFSWKSQQVLSERSTKSHRNPSSTEIVVRFVTDVQGDEVEKINMAHQVCQNCHFSRIFCKYFRD